MTIEQFRKLALSLPGAVEAAHMNHPDFRVDGRIFASLHYPDVRCGMVKLPPELQRRLIDEHPDAFEPCRGAWGRQGCTSVNLAKVPSSILKVALKSAFASMVSKTTSKPTRARAARSAMASKSKSGKSA